MTGWLVCGQNNANSCRGSLGERGGGSLPFRKHNVETGEWSPPERSFPLLRGRPEQYLRKKRKGVVWGSAAFWPSSFLEKISVSCWHRMCSTFVKPWCAALSSGFSAQRFSSVKLRCAELTSKFDAPMRPTIHSKTITAVSAARVLHTTFVLQVQHACNPGHILCSSFFLPR